MLCSPPPAPPPPHPHPPFLLPPTRRDKILGKIEGRNKRLREREMRAENAALAAANDDMPELEDDEEEEA